MNKHRDNNQGNSGIITKNEVDGSNILKMSCTSNSVIYYVSGSRQNKGCAEKKPFLLPKPVDVTGNVERGKQAEKENLPYLCTETAKKTKILNRSKIFSSRFPTLSYIRKCALEDPLDSEIKQLVLEWENLKAELRKTKRLIEEKKRALEFFSVITKGMTEAEIEELLST